MRLGGLHFALGDHRSLARVIRRAATEEGLWENLRARVPDPPARTIMVDLFLNLYDTTPFSTSSSPALHGRRPG